MFKHFHNGLIFKRYIGSQFKDKIIYIFMEYCSGESLLQIIGISNGLSESVIQKYLKEILEGLDYIHSKNIQHG